MDLSLVINALGDFTEDAILITEAEPVTMPGPRIVWCNAAFTRMTGYTLDEVKGETPRILQGPDTDTKTLSRLRHDLETWQSTKVELKNYRKDGTPFWVEFIVRPIADETGFFHYWISVQRETTERVEREALLRKTTQILERAPFGLALLDAEAQVSYANPTLEHLLFDGTVPPDAELPYATWMRHALSLGRIAETPSAPDAWLQNHLAQLFSGRFQAEHRVDGRYFEFRRLPLSNGSALLLVYDVEDRHLLQEQLDRAGRLDAMGQITGGVAHDFNNLLAVILGNLELLRIPQIAAERDTFIQEAIDATLRGRELTKSLLGFARKSRLQPAQCDLTDLVADCQGMITRVLPPSIEIETDLPETSPPVLVDRTLFENALLNLAINARDAMEKRGAITFSVREVPTSHNGSVQADAAPSGYVEVAVNDTGGGIPEALIDRVVEPFFTTKEVGAGSGMGLSLVHGFVEQSGGDMQIDSREGHGTTVRLRFPKLDHTPAPVAQDQPPGRDGLALHVLLVEDDPAVRRVVGVLLTDLGCTFEAFETGAEALARLARPGHFDLLLTDLAMPGEAQGDTVARAFLTQRPSQPVVMLCGNPDDMQDTALLEHPLFQVLLKPVQRRELQDSLARAAQMLPHHRPDAPTQRPSPLSPPAP